MLAAVYTAAPPRKPIDVETKPPVLKASSISSNESAEINTPLPKAMTAAISRCETGVYQATAAPKTRAEPLKSPHRPAWIESGMPVYVGVPGVGAQRPCGTRALF